MSNEIYKYKIIKPWQGLIASLVVVLAYFVFVHWFEQSVNLPVILAEITFAVLLGWIPLFSLLYYLFGLREPQIVFENNYIVIPCSAAWVRLVFIGHDAFPTYYRKVDFKEVKSIKVLSTRRSPYYLIDATTEKIFFSSDSYSQVEEIIRKIKHRSNIT